MLCVVNSECSDSARGANLTEELRLISFYILLPDRAVRIGASFFPTSTRSYLSYISKLGKTIFTFINFLS